MADDARYLGPDRSVGRFQIASVIALTLLYSSAWALAQAERPSPVQGVVPNFSSASSPVDFRCDTLEVISKPKRQFICRGHVLLRRDLMLLCCKTLIGTSGLDGSIESVRCEGDVRLIRDDQTLWSALGQYNAHTGDVVLTGKPLLQRAAHRVAGAQVTLHLGEEHARVTQPRGQILTGEQSANPPVLWPKTGPLPSSCPIGPRPPEPR